MPALQLQVATACNAAAENTQQVRQGHLNFIYLVVIGFVTNDCGVDGLVFHPYFYRPVLQMQLTTPCNGTAGRNTINVEKLFYQQFLKFL